MQNTLATGSTVFAKRSFSFFYLIHVVSENLVVFGIFELIIRIFSVMLQLTASP